MKKKLLYCGIFKHLRAFDFKQTEKSLAVLRLRIAALKEAFAHLLLRQQGKREHAG
jgi:hypothetical protein